EAKLFATFAAVKPTPAGIADFATRYGLLGLTTGKVSLGPDNRPVSEHPEPGEPLVAWVREITAMRRAVALWQATPKQRSRQESKASSPARVELHTLINERLERYAVPQLLALERPRFLILPQGLIGALWVQLARAIEGDVAFRQCNYRHCANWI